MKNISDPTWNLITAWQKEFGPAGIAIADDMETTMTNSDTTPVVRDEANHATELLPCPMCGSNEIYLRDMAGWEIACACGVDCVLPDNPSREGVVGHWNTRASFREWQPIETAPKDGRTLLLGYLNGANRWRTMRGQWYSNDLIMMDMEEPDDHEEGWYETSVEADEPPNVWTTNPTHWMPLPDPPVTQKGSE